MGKSTLVTRRTPWWIRLGRRLFGVWDGAGVIVDKRHRDAYTGDVLVPTGRAPVYGSGTVAERWVLVVRDSDGIDHYVNVGSAVWERHAVGDVITARDPLIDLN